MVDNLQRSYDEGIREHVGKIAHSIPASRFGKGKPRLTGPASDNGLPLREFVAGQILTGVKTGLNEAFIISDEVHHRLIAEDPRSTEILKPILAGDNVRHYEIHFGDTYLVWTYIGVPIKEYPAIFKHLKQFRAKAERRQDQGTQWWELRSCSYYEAFSNPKIIYPQIMPESRFYMDTRNFFTNQKCFIIPSSDWYLLGVLNSDYVWRLIKDGSPSLRGGYAEPRRDFMLNLLIPAAPTGEREAVAKLARQAQELHTKRRRRVEKFLRAVGIAPAASSSRNPLEQPWTLSPDEFTRRTRHAPLPSFTAARDETHALTAQITTIERELDERVAALYGVPPGAG